MSQLPRLKRVADIQHPNIGRVDNGDPEHAHFLEDSKDLSYFAKRHRRPPLDEVVQIVELSSASSSSSYFSEEEEDEANKYERVFPSNTHGNPLYIRPGRCQVNNGIMHAPHPKVDIMLTTISFVMAAVHVACLAEGKNFSLPPSNRRANNSFYYPLEGLKTDLWALYVGIGSWSRRFKQMEWEELKLTQLIRTRRLTEEEKIGKVHRALRRIGDITDGYVFSFSTIAKELQPVHLELKRLMFLLTCIIQEGNTLEPNAVKVDKEAFKHPEDIVNDENKATEEAENEVLQKEEHAITENDASAEENGVAIKEEEVSPYDGYETSKTSNPELRPHSPRAKENEEAPVPAESSPEAHTPYQKDTIEPSIDDSAPNDLTFPDPFITRPPTPRHPHTPTWKHALRHLNIANLYVGDLEIQIFKEVLALARDVQHALVKVVRLCEELGARAAGKQDTWNEWKEVVEGWNAKERGDDGDRYGF